MHNNLQFIPFSTIKESDIFSLFSDTELLKYTDVPIINPIDEVSHLRSFYSNTRIAFGIQLSNACIGMVAAYCNNKHRTAVITFIIRSQFQHKGYMQQALAWFHLYLFEQCNIYRIEAQTYVKNIASVQLLEKMGYICEGCLRKNFMIANKLEDSYMYSLLREE